MKYPVKRHMGQARDLNFMRMALAQAEIAALEDEVPIGAVIEMDGKVLAESHNSPISRKDACAHAEILAIRQACETLGNYRLGNKATLYVTLQPCLMCLGAILNARIGRVVVGSDQSRFNSNLPDALQLFESSEAWHGCEFETGCMESECESLLTGFFKQKRRQREGAVAALADMLHLPNANRDTVTELAAMGYSTPQDFLLKGLDSVASHLETRTQELKQAGLDQQAAIFSSLVDYFRGEGVRSWKHYLNTRE